jgi:hypothetical protein
MHPQQDLLELRIGHIRDTLTYLARKRVEVLCDLWGGHANGSAENHKELANQIEELETQYDTIVSMLKAVHEGNRVLSEANAVRYPK